MNIGDTRALKELINTIYSLVEEKGKLRVNGAVNSLRTCDIDVEVMKNFSRTLHCAGFKLEDIRNLREKHVAAVFDQWVLVRKLSNKTLQGQKSRVKIFCTRLGKPGLARYVSGIDSRYVETHPKGFVVKSVAELSKSWRGAGLNVEGLFKAALLQDRRHAAMLMMGRAFGLRKKEMLLTNLWKADKGDLLSLTGNVAKNGRPRDIAIEGGEFGEMQRRVLDFSKGQCKRSESLAWPELDLKSADRRYFYYNAKLGLTKEHFGLTGHGLRAGYAEDLMLLRGVLPPTLGGTKEMSSEMTRKAAKFNASKALGHNRESITHAYYGSDKRFARAGDLLGFEFAEPMVLSSNSKGVLWVSENLVSSSDQMGQFELQAETVELAYITVQIVSDGNEVDRMSVDQFLGKYPVAFDALNVRVGKLGLFVTLGG